MTLALLHSVAACADTAPLGPVDAGAFDGGASLDAGASSDAGVLEMGSTFVVPLSVDADGALTELKLYGAFQLTAQPPSVLLALADGPAISTTLTRSGARWLAGPLELERDFLILQRSEVELRDRWSFTTLSFDLDSSPSEIRVSGEGRDHVWLSSDVYDERNFVASGTGLWQATAPQVRAVGYGTNGPWSSACGPLELAFEPPFAVAGIGQVRAEQGGQAIELEAPEPIGVGAGYANRAVLRPIGCWPLGGEIELQLPPASLHGGASPELVLSAPAAPNAALQSSEFADASALSAWRGLDPPVLETIGAPYALDGQALVVTGAAAWAMIHLSPGPHHLTLRLSYWARAEGVPPNNNPDWVLGVFGWSATLGGPTAILERHSVDLRDHTMAPQANGDFALPPETIRFDIDANAPRQLILELAPRSFLRSPAVAYGYLLVDSVQVE